MRGDVTQNRLRGEHLCVGCGICALVCPTRALAMVYSKLGQHEPRLDAARCTRCGTCLHYCPVELRKLRESTEANLEGADPLMAGLEGSSCYVAHDPDPLHRLHSASGGAITAILVRLLEQGELDAVIHAERLSAPVGGSHFAACVSRTAEACGQRRGSLYGPLCYQEALEGFRGSTARLAITGVPCVLAGMRRLFAEHPEFCRARPLLAGLVCSHNVSGLFVDFLARSMGLPATQPFEADLRDKAGIPDANNFNTCFRSGGRVLARENRFRNLFTTLWRSHAFALEACHYCPDFWGKAADLCVKDAWGKWAEDPLGKSIVAVRHPGIRSLLEEGTLLSVEALPLDQAALCQKETSTYKLLAVTHRLEKCWCSRLNRESGFAFHFATARLSRVLFRRLGYRLSRTLLLAFLPPDGIRRSRAPGAASSGSESLRERLLANLPPAPRTLALFGAGAMAGDLLAALPDRIAFLVDNDAGKQGRRLGGKPIQAPRDLAERQDRPYILIGVAKDSAIASQLEGYGFREGRDFLRCAPLHEATTKANRQAGGHKPRRKILVLGGYGYRNTGDEAQLNANLKDLARLFPDHLVQVLSPDPAYTHFHHERCSVSEAPRKAFYDTDTSGLYALQSPLDKARFLSRSLWLYLNAFLVSRGLPPFLLKAKRCALLHELESASLVFFSGGGYLTGSTLSRLWDGLFFMAFARVLKVPVVLSGQTLGVWNSRFTRWLAGWGLRKAALITVRDADESLKALAELGLQGLVFQHLRRCALLRQKPGPRCDPVPAPAGWAARRSGLCRAQCPLLGPGGDPGTGAAPGAAGQDLCLGSPGDGFGTARDPHGSLGPDHAGGFGRTQSRSGAQAARLRLRLPHCPGRDREGPDLHHHEAPPHHLRHGGRRPGPQPCPGSVLPPQEPGRPQALRYGLLPRGTGARAVLRTVPGDLPPHPRGPGIPRRTDKVCKTGAGSSPGTFPGGSPGPQPR